MTKAAIGLLLATVIVGCSSGGPPELKTYPVSGKVFYNQKPLAGATVAFWAPKAARASTGTTDADGEFTLEAPAGENKITVTKAPPVPAGAASMERGAEQAAKKLQARADQAKADAAKAAASRKKPKEPPPKPILPLKYSTVGQTPLQGTVTAKGPNKFDKLELVD